MQAALAIALALLVGAPTRAAALEDCRRCSDRGVTACKRCARDACESEKPPALCSVAAACSECGGTRLVPCGRCQAAPELDLAARRTEIAAWREGMAAIDRFMDRELRHSQSAHFVLTWGIEKIDLGPPHLAMHAYLDRLEDLMAAFQRDVGAESADFSAPTRVLLWSREQDQEKASLEYTLQPSSTESKLMGARPVVSIYYDKGHLHEEFELHQAVVHQTVHCLLSNVFDGIWPGNIHGGWIDEGLAHWYETSLFGGVRHYCYVESDTIVYFEYGRWEPTVRVAVDRGENLGLLSVTASNTVDMTNEQRMYAWSLCDYLLRAKPGTLGPIARAVKQKQPLPETLSRVLGVTPFELERDWKAWVRATYSPKKTGR